MVHALNVKLVLGPQLNQLHAQLVMPVMALLKAQNLLPPVLPALVKMLDVSHVLTMLLTHAQNVMEAML